MSYWNHTLLLLCGTCLLAIGILSVGCSPVEPEGSFQKTVVDADGPIDPWGKAVGDINGDGKPDLIVGGNHPKEPDFWRRILKNLHIQDYSWPTGGELVWYESPTWQKHLVSDEYRFRTDHEVADIDADGRNDIVGTTDSGLFWFKNPEWEPVKIDSRELHDVEVADFDGDGDIDIVARNQRLFGYNDADIIHFYRQDSPSKWVHIQVATSQGEGLSVADMDGDSRPDVIVNFSWYRNPGKLSTALEWEPVFYCPTWTWPDVFIDIADMNNDGRQDVILAPAEPTGDTYRLSWCESPEKSDGEWREHIIDPQVESVVHSIRAGDFNNDGLMDIVSAEMVEGQDPDDVSVYWNSPENGTWEKEVIASTGSHSMRTLDCDADGDLDLFGANWSGENRAVDLWVNKKKILKSAINWNRHVIDSEKPWQSVFVMSADLDGDGLRDIVTGGWWYKNPGTAGADWQRRTLGIDANNAAIISDFDGDGDLDVFSSAWNTPREWTFYEKVTRKLGLRSYYKRGHFVWSRNDGQGRFTVLENIEAGNGDFLQGAVTLLDGPQQNLALSWHEPGLGLQILRVPGNPIEETWQVEKLSDISQDEALSAADIDKDGKLDLILGTKWLRKEEDGKWTEFTLHKTEENPDRNSAVDMNGDGNIDIVIGYEAISVPGKLAWYEQNGDPTQLWDEHVIAEVIGPMSLTVIDMDSDSDLDIVVGEHNLAHPERARLLWFENLSGDALHWKQHLVYVGDEHHDGAHVVDIDNDGDMDIVSIGWGHDRLLLYENLKINEVRSVD